MAYYQLTARLTAGCSDLTQAKAQEEQKGICFAYACAVGDLFTVCFYSFGGEEDSLDVAIFFLITSMQYKQEGKWRF